jgi:His/Glu/Gln/Arg/opine family amino acid ABC transporter permease subunit
MADVLVKNLPYLLSGAIVTVWLAGAVVLLSTALGIVVGTIGAVGGPTARALVTAYIFVLRGIPVLVVMFLGYYAFPAMGYRVNAYVAVGIAQIVYAGAFVAEIVRSAILSVPSSQVAAARSLGMRRRKILTQVVIPQAIRLAIPPLLNTALTTIKQTSYASIVGAWELTYAAREIVERTLASFQIFLGVMAIYFVICYPLAVLSRRLERRFVVAH